MNSETPKAYIESLIIKAVSGFTDSASFNLSEPPNQEKGDYATNAALVLAKKAGKNPKELAEELAAKIRELDEQNVLREVQIVNNFINFFVSAEYLQAYVSNLSRSIYIEQKGKGQKVVFEYSSPNTNKALHIGHTRNDLYGKSCINLLKAVGYDVVSCEIINDRGIHIMKSMLMYQKYGEGKTPQSEQVKPDHFVGKFYQMFAQKAGESPEQETVLLQEAQDLLRKWEEGDEQTRALWKQMNDWFFEGVKQTYEREGTDFDEVDFEHQIYGHGRDIVLEGVKNGIFQKEEDGSISVTFPEEELGKKYLLRKDGTTIYITQDLYLWDVRNKRHHPNLAIVTTSAEQAYHFRVLGKLFKLVGYDWADGFRHLPYEHVFLGQSKMSSREGKTISADELVDIVKARVKELMSTLQKLKGSTEDDQLIEDIAYGAIKYGYLKYEPNTRIYFDLDSTIAIEGNTGIYIQYAHARMCSILKKTGEIKASDLSGLGEPSEQSLMRWLLHYSEAVQNSASDYKPNLLCNYLYELAAKFNNFYNAVPILQEPDESIRMARLNMLLSVKNVLQHGLGLLGIKAPEEM